MKPLDKGSNYVKVPFMIKSSSKVFASWAYEVREGIKTLKERIPVGYGSAPGNSALLSPLLARVKRKNVGGSLQLFVSIRPGYVNGIMPTVGGVALDAAVPPLLSLSEGENFLHLIGDYQPTVYELVTGYAAIGSAGTVAAPEFVLTASSTPSPAESYPIVSGGAGVDGNFDILWAKFTRTGSVVTVDIPSGGGDAEVVFMPPNLYVAFRDVERSA